ncbi:MAG: integrase arm-type DNA-binding domain-containing protein [Beijerinckiaceae bacterium]|jgi:integrase
MAQHKLTAVSVRNLKEPGRHADGGNLYLNISKTGGKSWVFFFRRDGRLRELGLGPVRDVSLTAAREKAALYRERLAAGLPPKPEGPEAKPKTFGECADDFLMTMEAGWRNSKHRDQWKMTLTVYAASLRAIPVQDVSTADVLKVLTPIWSTKPETASRLRGRIESVLNAAKARGLRSGENPAAWKGLLDNVLPRRSKLKRGHHAAMAIDDLPPFIAKLREQAGASARALELVILTAVRSGEALGARWDEIDKASTTWTIPAERMKANRAHRVPLSARALDIIAGQEAIRVNDFIFPGAKHDAPLSNMSLAMTLRRMGVDVTVHGFRSTFRDWISEKTAFPSDAAEMALAHTIANKVEAAYRRGNLFQKRIELMNAWGDFAGSEK